VEPNRVICDFSDAAIVKKWSADAPIVLSHDNTGMLLTADKKAKYPQASMAISDKDWSGFQDCVVEMENLGDKPQMLVFRARSNDDNGQRSDVHETIPKGKYEMRFPVAGLKKTKQDAITKIYLMTLNVPEDGCKIRVTKLYLEPKRAL